MHKCIQLCLGAHGIIIDGDIYPNVFKSTSRDLKYIHSQFQTNHITQYWKTIRYDESFKKMATTPIQMILDSVKQ